MAKLPKPAAPTAEEIRQQRNGQNGRRHDGGAGRNANEGQPKRHFSRPKGAPGAHKGAVKRFGGR